MFHGSKMLVNMPANLVVPTVCVNDRIFFTDELLRTSDGTYFIPHRFFYRLPRDAKLSGIPTAAGLAESDNAASSQAYEPSVHDLWSLGREVARTDVCFLASDVNGFLIFFSRPASLFRMRSQPCVLTSSGVHFWTFNPISENSSAGSQVSLVVVHSFFC